MPPAIHHLQKHGLLKAENLLADRYLRSFLGEPLGAADQARLGSALVSFRLDAEEQALWEHRFRPNPTGAKAMMQEGPFKGKSHQWVNQAQYKFFTRIVKRLDLWDVTHPSPSTTFSSGTIRDAQVLGEALAEPLANPHGHSELRGFVIAAQGLASQPLAPRTFEREVAMASLPLGKAIRDDPQRRAAIWARKALGAAGPTVVVRDLFLPLLDMAHPDRITRKEVDRSIATAQGLFCLSRAARDATPYRWAARQLDDVRGSFHHHAETTQRELFWPSPRLQEILERWATVLANAERTLLTV